MFTISPQLANNNEIQVEMKKNEIGGWGCVYFRALELGPKKPTGKYKRCQCCTFEKICDLRPVRDDFGKETLEILKSKIPTPSYYNLKAEIIPLPIPKCEKTAPFQLSLPVCRLL
jgi:hypothetical protein